MRRKAGPVLGLQPTAPSWRICSEGSHVRTSACPAAQAAVQAAAQAAAQEASCNGSSPPIRMAAPAAAGLAAAPRGEPSVRRRCRRPPIRQVGLLCGLAERDILSAAGNGQARPGRACGAAAQRQRARPAAARRRPGAGAWKARGPRADSPSAGRRWALPVPLNPAEEAPSSHPTRSSAQRSARARFDGPSITTAVCVGGGTPPPAPCGGRHRRRCRHPAAARRRLGR